VPPLPSRALLAALAAAVLAGAASLTPQDSSSGHDSPRRATAHLASDWAPRRVGAAVEAARRWRPAPPTRERTAAAAPAIVPNDPLWPAAWSLAKARVSAAWAAADGAAPTVVAVLDTGVDAAHPDLAGVLVPGWNAVAESPEPTDGHGHGTFVAGVIAAQANNGVGGLGACWRCSVMPVKVIGDDGTGTAADVAEGLVWAADHGAHVINLSFVLGGYDSGVAGAVAYARAKGALVVAAAGNSGTSDVTFPAAEPGVVSVTATDPNDAHFAWATFGGWVSVAAPGCSHSTAPGGGYGEFCGTSSATAFASGVAALVRTAGAAPAADTLAAALGAGAVPVGDFVARGRLDAANALASLRASCCGGAGRADRRPVRPARRPGRR
jgi:thermitase